MDGIQRQIEEMQTKLDELIRLANSSVVVDCEYTFLQWLELWLTEYKAPNVKPYTLRSKRTNIRLHIVPHIEDKPLNRYKPVEIQSVLNKVPTSKTRQLTRDIFSEAFRQAYRNELIQNNPMDKVDAVKHRRSRGKALTVKTQAKFLQQISGSSMEKLYRFYLLSGARLSEALDIDLQKDIDFEKKQIHINGTKTDGSDRFIPLFAETEKLIKSLPYKKGFAFPYTANAVKCNFRRLKAKCDFDFSIHSLRHTFATRCLESGISLKTIQKWLGHTKLDTTANTYVEVLAEFEIKEIVKFNPKF